MEPPARHEIPPPCHITSTNAALDYVITYELASNLSCFPHRTAVGASSPGLVTTAATIIVGHLGERQLAAVGLAISLANVSGFTVLVGLSSTLQTTAGQAYGAKNFEEVCLSLQRCLLLCTVVLGVVGMLWLNSRSLLIATGQEEAVADLAASYLMYLFPGLCCYMVTICLENWLAAQRITIVQGTGGVILLAGFVPLCWILVQPLHMETNGAAIATSLGHLFLMLWMIGQTFIAIRSSLTMSWQGLSRRAFTDWCPFLRLAVPSLFVISDPWFALVWEWNTKAEGSNARD